ncbi:hypothetical protein D3C73_1202910 [compost metagenome]
MQRPVKRVKQELAHGAGGTVLARQKQDVAHGFDSAEVVRVHGYRQGTQEVVQGKPIAAFAAHRGDVQLKHIATLLHHLRAGTDQVAAGG